MALPGAPGWKIWRQAVLRTTGFPADRLNIFAAQSCAQLADAFLSDSASRDDFDRAFGEAVVCSSAAVGAIAADPLFTEAVAWQNPSVAGMLGKMAQARLVPPQNRRQRERERVVVRYWQRYCAKTETIGFFGPICWITVDPAARELTARVGPGLLDQRQVYLEHWALALIAERLGHDRSFRRLLPPVLQPHLRLHGRDVLHPTKPAASLSIAEAAVLALSDGHRPAREIAAAVVADPWSGLRAECDVYDLLDLLVARDLVRWGIDVPVRMDGEQVLRDRLAILADSGVRSRALALLDRVSAARDEVAESAGSPDTLVKAIERLDAEFGAVTGGGPARKLGQAYAGRRVYWEEATRDLELTVGRPVLGAIAAPLTVVLRAAQWLAAEMARAYLAALAALHAELAADLGSPQVPLGQLWFLAQGLFYGSGQRPADQVRSEFASRWARLFGLDAVAPTSAVAGVVTVSSADLAPALDEVFPARAPMWSGARLHSPDLQICADSIEAINAGDFFVVLGELHVAWATNACGGAVSGHPRPDELRAALAADLGPGRIRPLLPDTWPRNTPRLAFGLDDPADPLLGILPAPVAEPGRVIPVTSMTVVARADGELAARTDDGRSWPLAEVFAQTLSEVAVEAFKAAGAAPHSPRIVIDRMVVARETWRTAIGDTGLIGASGEAERYLALRRWRAELHLPERVFAKIATETKPVYVDFTSPAYAAAFHHMLRAACRAEGDDVEVVITEMLPTPAHAWVPDAAGRTYLSELRLQVRDGDD